MQIYNTATRRKEIFSPVKEGCVSMYVCGITPYDFAHIGNARPAIVFDTLYRFLKSQGYKVTYLRNFTDMDDKIINRSNELGVNWKDHVQKYIDIYHADMKKLNVLSSSDDSSIQEPRVTGHIIEIIQMILVLLDKGHAYVGESGDVLYDTTTFPEYGKLAGKNLDELIAGARVEMSKDKKNPTDFVLWKSAKPGEPQWNFNLKYPTVNAGRPGWHIECSAMANKVFGDSFDIHGGGEDLQFPHHECEVAQSKGASGGDHAKYWMHNAFINVDGEKMSKSLGNFKTIHGLLEKYSGEALRLWMLSSHYRKPMDLTQDILDAAENTIASFMRALETDLGEADIDDNAMNAYNSVLSDDLNTVSAIALMHEQAKKARNGDAVGQKTLKKMADVLGLLQMTPKVYFKGSVQACGVDIDTLIEERAQAKRNKDWAEADRIRDQLVEMGVILEDSKNGTVWRRK